MASVNKFIGVGNLTRDPETRFMSNGDAVTKISIACNESWKDKNGEKQEKVEYINVTFYKKLAEIVSEYCRKGQQIYVEGRIETRKYTDKQGIERYATGIIADKMQMLGSKSDSKQDKAQQSGDNSPQHKTGFEDMGDDIPF